MSKKVSIIGAGPGGLACALLLSHAGLEVEVFERLPYLGGRCSAIQAQGFRFDRGPTFFVYPKVLSDLFRHLGLDLQKEVPMQRLDPQFRLVFGSGGEMQIRSDLQAMMAEIGRFSDDDARRLPEFLQDGRHKMEALAPLLVSQFPRWSWLLDSRLLSLLPVARPHKSLETDLRSFFSDRRVRMAFSFQSRYLGGSAFQCPSLFSILSFLEHDQGVFYPRGGCAAVTEALVRLARERGVRFHLEEEVQEIVFDGRRVRGLRTAQGIQRTDALVINADFARAMIRLVPNHLRRYWTNQRMARKKFSCSAFMMYLGIRGEVPGLPHTVYLSGRYEDNMLDIGRRYRLSEDPSFYLHNPSLLDSGMAPPGHSALYVMVPVPHQHPNLDWQDLKSGFRRQVLDQLARVGAGNLEERIVYEQIITPDDWDRLEIHRGAIFSLSHTLDQLLHLRPSNRFTEMDRFYLVGGGTHPGTGLPLIFSSARLTAQLLCEDLGIRPA